jgi:hypothetical protein
MALYQLVRNIPTCINEIMQSATNIDLIYAFDIYRSRCNHPDSLPAALACCNAKGPVLQLYIVRVARC